MGGRFCWHIMLLISFISFWVFFPFFGLSNLLIVEREVLKSPNAIIDFSISPFSSISFCSHILLLCCLVYKYLGLLCLHGGLTILSFCYVPQFLVISFVLKPWCRYHWVYSVWDLSGTWIYRLISFAIFRSF